MLPDSGPYWREIHGCVGFILADEPMNANFYESAEEMLGRFITRGAVEDKIWAEHLGRVWYILDARAQMDLRRKGLIDGFYPDD